MDDEIFDLWEAGLSIDDIAIELDMKPSEVRNIINSFDDGK